ncbi:hypothetical protein BOX15_Mlig002997g2, partial [Macrostomum lignano]
RSNRNIIGRGFALKGMELSRREAGLFKRNDSCHCNSTGVSSVKDASDDFSSWLSQGGYSKIDSLTESHSDIKKTCLIDLTMKIVKNLSDQLTATEATAEAADSDATGDGASDTETATPPRVKLRVKESDSRQSKSSKAAPRPSGRSCLIKVTVASHPASLSSPLQRRRATNTGSRISFSEPLRALDTASESEEQSLNDSSTESTDTSGDVPDGSESLSPTRSFGTSRHLGRRCSTDDEECTQSASTESVSIVQQSRQASRRRQTDRSGNNVNNTDNAPLVSGDTKDSSKVTKTLPSVAVTAAGDAAGLKASQPCEQIKKSCLMPEPSLRLLQQQKQQEQQQQQLFTRSAAESSKDSEGYSYNTVSTHCIEPWLPDLEAAGTLDGFCCADFSSAAVPASGAAGPRRQVEQLQTTTTQSATPSDSSTVMDSGEVDETAAWDQLVFQSQLSRLRKQIYGDNGWSSTDRKPALMMPKFPAESIDRQLGSVDSAGKTHGLSAAASASDEAPASDQLILQSQLSSLRNQLYGDSERVLIPPPVFWKSRKQKQKMPKFSPQEVQEQQARVNSPAHSGEPSATKVKQGVSASLMKPRIFKKARAVQSLVPLPRPSKKQASSAACKKQKSEQPKLQKLRQQKEKQKQAEPQQQKKKTVKKRGAAKKQPATSSLSAIEVASRPKASTALSATTKASSVKRASGTKFVTFSRPVYM